MAQEQVIRSSLWVTQSYDCVMIGSGTRALVGVFGPFPERPYSCVGVNVLAMASKDDGAKVRGGTSRIGVLFGSRDL